MPHRASLLILAALLIACDGSPPPSGMDAGRDSGASIERCSYNADCDDGLYCTGSEVCDPGHPSADARGCVQLDPPCSAEEGCEEAARRCLTCTVADHDGDGHDRVACGGDDCDDEDAQRYPGNPEICDEGHRDEDCDPGTVGPDADGDGFREARCCNRQDYGSVRCGSDCDDGNALINIDGAEVCGGGDEDCDGLVDEGLSAVYYRDADLDGDGDPSRSELLCGAITEGYALNADDCDDTDATRPRSEECEGSIDEDCDGGIDEGCACTAGVERSCGPDTEIGACTRGTQSCIGGVWSPCADAVQPTAETCDSADNDCDGSTDEDLRLRLYPDGDGDGFGNPSLPIEVCEAPEGSWVDRGGDCDDGDEAVHPGAIELCNRIDDDCDEAIDAACGCAPGNARPCGPADGAGGVLTDGLCAAGEQRCIDGSWGRCEGATYPALDLCDGFDNDCIASTADGSGESCAGSSPSCCCPGGRLDCDGDLASSGGNGCEVNPASDPSNCGGCGLECGARASCDGAGRCVCDDGYGDCDGDLGTRGSNGCETDLNTDAAHCGACGASCSRLLVVTSGCEAGLCEILECQSGWADCDREDSNGCETDVLLDDEHCGECGNRCINATCGAGLCICDAERGDCDDNPSTCETALGTTSNCGACGDACAAGDRCEGGTCVRDCEYTAWATTVNLSQPANAQWTDRPNAVGVGGPDGVFAYAPFDSDNDNVLDVSGFGHIDRGQPITRVELVYLLYLSAPVSDDQLNATLEDGAVTENHTFPLGVVNGYVGAGSLGELRWDVTALRTWTWADLATPDLFSTTLETHMIPPLPDSSTVYLDAIALRVTTSASCPAP